MQRISSLTSRRELGGLAACAAGIRASKSGWTCWQKPAGPPQWLSVNVRPSTAEPGRSPWGRRSVFAAENRRLFSSRPPRSSDRRPVISVVGIPDPLTWIRCKVVTLLIDFYFQVDINSEEFVNGAKQALVLVSSKMSRGRYHELVGLVSKEMVEYVEDTCKSLTDAQRRELAVSMDDIIFALPEDVSVVFDQHGRKFCFVVVRFWHLSAHEGPDDPEGSKIFKVGFTEDDGTKKKLSTAVYEFHRELTQEAYPEWTVTTVWHWNWKPAA
ncbi:m-AAA protease-interacting protein 1, mitochondrial [Xenentodon cancila]